jgi:hypothetical protein
VTQAALFTTPKLSIVRLSNDMSILLEKVHITAPQDRNSSLDGCGWLSLPFETVRLPSPCFILFTRNGMPWN